MAVVAASLASAGEPAPAAVDARPFILFMGADVAIIWKTKLYPVLGVAGSSFLIRVEDKSVKVPMDFGRSTFRIEPTLRLKQTSAVVTDWKAQRTYTPRNDPVARFQRELAKGQLQEADAAYAQHLASDILQNVANKQINTQGMDVTNAAFAAAAQNEAKAQQLQTATAVLNAANAGPGTAFKDENRMAPEGNFDAMDVSFVISSEMPLRHPYVLLTARFHAPDDNPGVANNLVYARELPAIGREPRKIEFTQGGFPPGFTLEDFQVHLYDRGEEVATSVAPKRMDLTRDEAFQYVTVEYISKHAGETLPVGPAVGRLPADFSTRVVEGRKQRTLYAMVTKDGEIAGLFADKSCAQTIDDPYVESVINELRFIPALDRGRPVDGVTEIKLTLPAS